MLPDVSTTVIVLTVSPVVEIKSAESVVPAVRATANVD